MDVIISIPLQYPDCVFLGKKKIDKQKKKDFKATAGITVQKPKGFFKVTMCLTEICYWRKLWPIKEKEISAGNCYACC